MGAPGDREGALFEWSGCERRLTNLAEDGDDEAHSVVERALTYLKPRILSGPAHAQTICRSAAARPSPPARSCRPASSVPECPGSHLAYAASSASAASSSPSAGKPSGPPSRQTSTSRSRLPEQDRIRAQAVRLVAPNDGRAGCLGTLSCCIGYQLDRPRSDSPVHERSAST